jgi:hypothetical protein
MCSGCSGDYSADYYDDSKSFANTPPEGAPTGDLSNRNMHIQRGSESDFARDESRPVSNAGHRKAVTGAANDEDWQVFVGVDRIVEVLVLRAKPDGGDRLDLEEKPAAGPLKTPGNGAVSQRSEALSAKSYRTRARPIYSALIVWCIRLLQLSLRAVLGAASVTWRL